MANILGKMAKGLCVPLLVCWWLVHWKTSKWTWKPFGSLHKWFWDLPNSGLWFWGFCAILVPIYIAYISIFLSIQILLAVFFIFTGLTFGVMLMAIGIWPAFILAITVTGITIITLPKNMYYHALVTYRSVILRLNLKY